MRVERSQMRGHGITLVDRETIFRMTRIQLFHNMISRSLCKYRGRADRRHLAVALDDGDRRARALEALERGQAIAVDLKVRRRHCQRDHRTTHGEQRRLQNIDHIDLGSACETNAPSNGTLLDQRRERRALYGLQRFRVCKPRNRSRRIENDRSRHHRSRKRTTTGFIHARRPLNHVLVHT